MVSMDGQRTIAIGKGHVESRLSATSIPAACLQRMLCIPSRNLEAPKPFSVEENKLNIHLRQAVSAFA